MTQHPTQSQTQNVLIIGGSGRIGRSVASDLMQYTSAQITLTHRHESSPAPAASFPHGAYHWLTLDLADLEELKRAIAASDLVIHCAGPFHNQDARVLRICIEQGVNYLDVSDSVAFTRRALGYHIQAQQAGITAVINSGVFPGLSNSMVRQAVEAFDVPKTVHISYVVGGSGGAGVTIMRTTFLGLLHPFQAWIDGRWQHIKPYTQREIVRFPQPFGRVGVYWYEMPETFTLAESFPVQTIVTKFGSVPDIYNHLTWITAHWFPPGWLQKPANLEALSQVSYQMTAITDRFSGIGVGIQVCMMGAIANQTKCRYSTLIHENTAMAAGYGTGSIAQYLLSGEIKQPGVWPVERILSTQLFERAMQQRQISLQTHWSSPNC